MKNAYKFKAIRRIAGLTLIAVISFAALTGCPTPSGGGSGSGGVGGDSGGGSDGGSSGGKTLTGITITAEPTKTQYNLGEELNTAGMVVTA